MSREKLRSRVSDWYKSRVLVVSWIVLASAILYQYQRQKAATAELTLRWATERESYRKENTQLQARLAEQERLGLAQAQEVQRLQSIVASYLEEERKQLAKQAREAAAKSTHCGIDAETQRRHAKERERRNKNVVCKNPEDPLCGI